MATQGIDSEALAERVAVAVAGAVAAQRPAVGVTDILEPVVKIATFCGVVASALGFIALYRQFDRLGVPTYFITVPAAARAGLLPSAAMLVAITVSQLAARYQEETKTALMISGISFGVLAAAALYAVIIPGVLVGVPWLLHFLIGPILGLGPVARFVVRHGMGLAAVEVVASYVAMLLLAGAVAVQIRRDARDKAGLFAATAATAPAAPAADPAPAPAQNAGDAALGIGGGIAITVLVIVVVMLYAAICLAGLRWLSATLGLGWPFVTGLGNGGVIFWSFVVTVIGAAAGLAAYVFLELRQANWDGRRGTVLATLAILGFAAFLGAYSMFYPYVTPALGGGLPQRVTLWTGTPELGRELLAASQGCRRSATLIRCDGVLTIAAGDRLLLLSKTGGPPLILAQSELKAIRLAR